MTRIARSLLSTLVVLAAAAIALLMLVPAVLGLQRYIIVSESMTGTYDKGSIVYGEKVPVSDLRVGDAITYEPPPGVTPTKLVTHRIVSIRHVRGQRVFRTKGDAVAQPDPWTFTLPEGQQPRVKFSVPYAGYPIGFLTDREHRMLIIGGPALLIAISVLAGLGRDWRRTRREGATRAPAAAV